MKTPQRTCPDAPHKAVMPTVGEWDTRRVFNRQVLVGTKFDPEGPGTGVRTVYRFADDADAGCWGAITVDAEGGLTRLELSCERAGTLLTGIVRDQLGNEAGAKWLWVMAELFQKLKARPGNG